MTEKRPLTSADEVDAKRVCVSASDSDWRYLYGPTNTVYCVNYTILKQKAPACYVTKVLANGEGRDPNAPLFLSVPIWYLEGICNYSQVFSSNIVRFAAHADEIADVLSLLSWTPFDDVRIVDSNTIVSMRRHNPIYAKNDEFVHRMDNLHRMGLYAIGEIIEEEGISNANQTTTYEMDDYFARKVTRFLKDNPDVRECKAEIKRHAVHYIVSDVDFEHKKSFTVTVKCSPIL